MQILKLTGGKTSDDLRAALANPGPPPAWIKMLRGPNAPAPGPPPAKPIGWIAAIEPGMSQLFTADFAPGNYAFVCFIPDSKDGKPHYAHGMTRQFSVN
jgi:hypothetical protein